MCVPVFVCGGGRWGGGLSACSTLDKMKSCDPVCKNQCPLVAQSDSMQQTARSLRLAKKMENIKGGGGGDDKWRKT